MDDDREAETRVGEETRRQTRRYDSPARENRAAETRARIVRAARGRFIVDGVSGATVEAIAAAAGVAAPTVYATFGSKAGLVRALLTDLEANADASGWRRRIHQADTPRARVRTLAGWSRALFGGDPELVAAAVDAGTGAGDLHQAGDQARRTALHGLARLLVADGALDAARVDQAVDEAWLVTGADVYVRATRGNGWSDDDYEDWLGSLLADHMVSGSDDHVES